MWKTNSRRFIAFHLCTGEKVSTELCSDPGRAVKRYLNNTTDTTKIYKDSQQKQSFDSNILHTIFACTICVEVIGIVKLWREWVLGYHVLNVPPCKIPTDIRNIT